ncbi:hypothetical protein PFISCL1PPCAC_19774, partial [Pristionchus fissidentatus]
MSAIRTSGVFDGLVLTIETSVEDSLSFVCRSSLHCTVGSLSMSTLGTSVIYYRLRPSIVFQIFHHSLLVHFLQSTHQLVILFFDGGCLTTYFACDIRRSNEGSGEDGGTTRTESSVCRGERHWHL